MSTTPSEKLKAVQHFPKPTNVKQLQFLLGLTGYVRKFIPRYDSIARRLSDLLRKSSIFKFGPQQRQALRTLRRFLSSAPVLHILCRVWISKCTRTLVKCFGAVLMQKSTDGQFHPVQRMNKKTLPTEEKLCSYELEVFVVIEALKKFRVYLHDTKFRIVTNCQVLKKKKKHLIRKTSLRKLHDGPYSSRNSISK